MNLDRELIIMIKTEEREQDKNIVFKVDINEMTTKLE
jgi:hypothetical protein